jgi:signal transduction histidine kinase
VRDLRDIAETLHDLRQPLSAARLFNATLQSRTTQDLRALTDGVENSLVAAEELLDGLLDIARLEAGAYLARPVRFPVGPMLESLQQQFAPLARQRSIAFNVRQTSVIAYSDPRLLRRVLQNLISNALRYTQAGQVIVGVRRRKSSTLELQVCDTGPGIDYANRESIFEQRFSAAMLPTSSPNSSSRRSPTLSPWGEQGLGLGLSICQRIATSLGAQLTLHSEPERGSVFGICVPRSRENQCAATAAR